MATGLAVHRTILVVDVSSFGDPKRTNSHQAKVRDALYRVLDRALTKGGACWSDCYHEDRGDGVLVIVGASVSKSLLTDRLPALLRDELRDHNASHRDEEQMRLRMALHAGEIHHDDHGVLGRAVTMAFRLLDAPSFKQAHNQANSLLGIIVSAWFFDEVVWQSQNSARAEYNQVVVSSKEVRTTAWVRLLDPTIPARLAPGAPAASTQTTPHRPQQLPPTTQRFIGRDAELAELSRLLDQPADTRTISGPLIAVIDGTAGVGKTTLALTWAQRVCNQFPDGQLYIDLRGYSPDRQPLQAEEVLEEFLTALGVQSTIIPTSLEARAKLYRSVLADRKVLVVLDNAATSQQLTPLLPGSSACGVLITSRNRLSGLAVDGDRRFTLGPMDEKESMTLLRKVIGAERADAEPEAMRALAHLCGDLPLALQIAAERVATHPHHSVQLLVDELTVEEERLEGLATDDSVTVKTVFSWSYQALPVDAARMFRLIGLHTAQHVRIGAAAALAGINTIKARRLLDQLAGVHLIEGIGEDRYRMHDLLHVYAAEQATAEEPADQRTLALRRVVDWYLRNTYAANHALAPQRHDPALAPMPVEFCTNVAEFDYDSALEWCDIELPNIVSATRTAAEIGCDVAAWQLPVGCFNYLYLVKRWTLWLAWHEIGVTAARQGSDHYGLAWVLTNLALAYRELRRTDEAKAIFLEAMILRIKVDDWVGQAWCRVGLGFVSIDQHEPGLAAAYFTGALEIFRQINDRHGECIALANVGDAHRIRGQHTPAVEALTAASALFRDIDDRWGETYCLVRLGDTYAALTRLGDALACFDRALDTRRVLGDRWGEGEALYRKGTLLHLNGEPDLAAKSLRGALEIFDELGDPRAADVRDLLYTPVQDQS